MISHKKILKILLDILNLICYNFKYQPTNQERTKNMIKTVVVKENNGGGISYEAYNSKGNIIAVITGIDQQTDQPDYAQEAIDLINGNWHYSDACQWYDRTGNSMGDMHETEDRELTADDVVDNHPSTTVITTITQVIANRERNVHHGQK